MRKNVLEAKGVLTALVLVAVGLLWPRLSYEALKEGQRVNQELRLLGKDLLSSLLLAWIVL